MKRTSILCVVGLFWGGLAAADEAFFSGLGHLPGGGAWSNALAVSADGSTVVGESDYTGYPHWPGQAFRWTRQTGMIGLGGLVPSYPMSNAEGVSGDGSVVVGASSSAPGDEAFRWTQAQGMIGLGDLQGGPPPRSAANAVSTDGRVIVGWAKNAGGAVEAFRWTEAGGMVGLGYLPGGLAESQALAASADGSVIVGFSETTQYPHGEAFRWENAKMLGLGVLPGADRSWGYAVSADGSVVAGRSAGNAFRWTAATGMVSLGPGGACGISADGSILVGASTEGPVLWDAIGQKHVLHDLLVNQYHLNLTGWELWSASSVSADGRTFVGYGVGPNGVEGWIAHIPEPATLPLLALALAATTCRRGRGARLRR